MATKKKDRKPSPVQFIDTAKELVEHTWFYISKFPKSTRFIFQTKISDLAMDLYINTQRANSIFVEKENEADRQNKRECVQQALGIINSLEGLLSIIQLKYYSEITEYGWKHWGELIDKERKLLSGLLKSI